MSATAKITSICEIAEAFGKSIGLADFDISRVVHLQRPDQDEWALTLRFRKVDPLFDDEEPEAIIIVDAETLEPRLLEGL